MRPSSRWLALALLLGAAGCQDNESAIVRGDRLWADSAYTSALAEYRLAVAQRGDTHARTRLAHALAVTGEADEAWQAYAALLDASPEIPDQAVYDLLRLARGAERRGDIFGIVSAVDAALQVRPALRVPETSLAAARFYRERDEAELALDYYTRALTALPPDSALSVLYEVGLTLEAEGQCADAMDYYRAFRQQAEATRSRRWVSLIAEAGWHTGNCAFRLAQEARQASRPSEALELYSTTIELGEPENLLDQALFERGEIEFALGHFDEALESYRAVIQRNPARTGQLVARAQERIDQIRFGPGMDSDTLVF
ncbi:MAG: tetratricopeptide repeat protein [Gemmatimonadota bacterium]